MRFDKVVRSAGFIRNMKTYTVIIKDGFFYLINTGPADRKINTANIFEVKAVNWLIDKYAKKIEEGEKKLQSNSLDQLSQEKDSFKIRISEIEEGKLKKNLHQLPLLILKTTQGKFRLEFRNNSMGEVEKLKNVIPINA